MTFARKTQAKYGAQIPSGQKKPGAQPAASTKSDAPAAADPKATTAAKTTKRPAAASSAKKA